MNEHARKLNEDAMFGGVLIGVEFLNWSGLLIGVGNMRGNRGAMGDDD